MGRRKLEMKRIEDKSSRQVTFSKRRAGLVKKARQLSVLCDVDVAVIVFSARGKLYESCSGGTNRYEKSCLEEEKRTIQRGAGNELRFHCQSTRYRICDELLQSVNRLVEEQNADKLSVTDMTELEEELDAALVQTRSRKTQLMMDYISTLHEKENKLSDEKDKMEKQVVSAKKHDGGGGLNDLATNQTNPPEPLVTLPLFKD